MISISLSKDNNIFQEILKTLLLVSPTVMDPPDPKNDSSIFKSFPTKPIMINMISLYRYDKIRKKYEKTKRKKEKKRTLIKDIFISVCIVLLYKD